LYVPSLTFTRNQDHFLCNQHQAAFDLHSIVKGDKHRRFSMPESVWWKQERKLPIDTLARRDCWLRWSKSSRAHLQLCGRLSVPALYSAHADKRSAVATADRPPLHALIDAVRRWSSFYVESALNW